MQIYEIPHINLDVNIQYRILSPAEAHALLDDAPPNASTEDFMRFVLEKIVLNLRGEVTDALRSLPKEQAKLVLSSVFNGCVMLNPAIDFATWVKISGEPTDLEGMKPATKKARTKNTKKTKKITRSEFLNLEHYLKTRVIGQDDAIDQIVHALKRSHVGLNDESRPLGVFLFAGASGIGKSYLARELHNYLFSSDHDLIRVDCGEYQHKHESAKLIGAPPGYTGYDDGGHLTNQMLKHPQTVVLLDEVEKAHPDIWNTFLRVFDEGFLTDGSGREVSFHDAIIIMTTNLGNRKVVDELTVPSVGFGGSDRTFGLPQRTRIERLANDAIRKHFRPELLNRIDKVVVFNHLSHEDFLKIADLELRAVDQKLSKRGLSMQWDEGVLEQLVAESECNVQGARKLAQTRRERIEDLLADLLLKTRFVRGTIFQLTTNDSEFHIEAQRPTRIKAESPVTTAKEE